MIRCTPLQARAVALCLVWLVATAAAQDPPADRRPAERDPDLAQKVEQLEDAFGDRRMERDAEATGLLRYLAQAAGRPLHEDDEKLLLDTFDKVLTRGRLREPDARAPYEAAADGLAALGSPGASRLIRVHERKRFPRKPDWEPMRAKLVECIGRVPNDETRPFLTEQVQRSGEHSVLLAAGSALGRFRDADQRVRKELVELLANRLAGFENVASQSAVDDKAQLNLDRENAERAVEILRRPWCEALSALTGASHATGNDWAKWYREHKREPWPDLGPAGGSR
ncbi:MAG: hypothetical protein IPM29_18010 [Planctomycetes bacterium]|nr:hypothetical protein [Planctomycetota bacterium]